MSSKAIRVVGLLSLAEEIQLLRQGISGEIAEGVLCGLSKARSDPRFQKEETCS